MDWSEIVGNVGKDQYQKRIETLETCGRYTESIKKTVEETIKNVKTGGRSFVIFGEPQVGKPK